MTDTDILNKTKHFLASCLSANTGVGNEAIASATNTSEVASQIVDALLTKHNGQTDAAFRDESRQLGLTLKKDSDPALIQSLLSHKMDADTLVHMNHRDLASKELQTEILETQEKNLKDAVIVDNIEPLPDADDERRDLEGGLKDGPHIASLEGIDFS